MGTGSGWYHEPVPMDTFSPGWRHQSELKPCAAHIAARKFSPTSLAEGAREWFISPTPAALSSSSQMQAFGPKHTVSILGLLRACILAYGWVSSRIQAVVA